MKNGPEGARIYEFKTREQRLAQVLLRDRQKEQAAIDGARQDEARFGTIQNLDLDNFISEFELIDDKASGEQLEIRDALDIYLENALQEKPVNISAVTYSEHQGRDLYHIVRYHGVFDRALIKNAVKNWDEVRNSDVRVSPQWLGHRWLEISIQAYMNDSRGNSYRAFDDEPLYIPVSKIAAITFADSTV